MSEYISQAQQDIESSQDWLGIFEVYDNCESSEELYLVDEIGKIVL